MRGSGKGGAGAVIGCACAVFWSGSFIFGFPGVMGPHWKSMFEMGHAAVGSILFFILAATGVFMFFVGRWQERVGLRAMITIGALFTALDMVLLAYVTHLYALYLWAFIMGAASCFLYIPALTTVQKWYPGRRGLMTGLVNLMFAASAALMAPVFRFLFDLLGYETLCLVLGVASGVVGVAAAQFTAPPAAGSAGSAAGSAPALQLDLQRSLTVSQSLRTRAFWFLWLTWALQGSAGIAMVMLSVSFGLSRGLAMRSAVLMLTCFNLANGVSRPVSGYLSDRVGRTFVMSLSFFCAAVAYFVLPHVDGPALFCILGTVIGFAFGTLVAVSAPLAVDCFGIRHFGAIFGLVFTAYGFLAGPLGPSLSGYLLDATGGDFFLVFRYLGVFCLLAAVLIRLVRPPQ